VNDILFSDVGCLSDRRLNICTLGYTDTDTSLVVTDSDERFESEPTATLNDA
jgi:hypothetical protein